MPRKYIHYVYFILQLGGFLLISTLHYVYSIIMWKYYEFLLSKSLKPNTLHIAIVGTLKEKYIICVLEKKIEKKITCSLWEKTNIKIKIKNTNRNRKKEMKSKRIKLNVNRLFWIFIVRKSNLLVHARLFPKTSRTDPYSPLVDMATGLFGPVDLTSDGPSQWFSDPMSMVPLGQACSSLWSYGIRNRWIDDFVFKKKTNILLF